MEKFLRPFQSKLREAIRGVISQDSQIRDFFCNVTPGGGKSMLPKLAFNELRIAGLVDHILWVVPTAPLRRQAAIDMNAKDVIDGTNVRFAVWEATNDINPRNGTDGYITTYHALADDAAGINLNELSRSRYLLVCDEFHHIYQGGSWHRHTLPLYENTEWHLFMTGTLERHDRKPIGFLPYERA